MATHIPRNHARNSYEVTFSRSENSHAAEKIAIYESSGDAKIRAPELSIMAITFREAGP